MKTVFKGKRIESILGVLPEKLVLFDDEISNYAFPEKQTLRLKKVMGYKQHRISKESTTVSDMAAYGLAYMFDNDWIKKEDVGAIVVVTLCPDYYVPHISTILQAKFGLDKTIACIDLSQGCCGFVQGLFESFMLLEHMQNKKVILVNGDILSHKVSKRDRNDYPLIGDGVAISIIENSDSDDSIFYEMNVDGSEADALKIPAGAFRMPSTPSTAEMEETDDGNFRSLDHMHMDGSAVFNFVQREVPPMIDDLLIYANEKKEAIDYYLFHQPNKFMLQKLGQKLGISEEKMPMNLVELMGNPSGASIPLVTAMNLSAEMLEKEYRCCLAGFGSGLAWGGIIMNLGKFKHCEYIVSDL